MRRSAVATIMKDLEDVDVGDDENPCEDGVVGHFVAIFTFSFLVGLVILYTSVLWQRIHHGDSFHLPVRSVERLMVHYYGADYYYDPPLHFDLAVNTTYFIH